MVQLPGGKFQMGSSSLEERNEEGPVREVTVKPFAIDKHPVTNGDFRYERRFSARRTRLLVLSGAGSGL